MTAQPPTPEAENQLTGGTSRAYRTVDNAAFNLAGWLWPIVLGIAFTPYIVRELGRDAYGLVVIVSLVAGYLALLDLGLGSAAIKYVAEFHSQGRKDLVRGAIGTTLTVFLLMGLVGVGAIVVLATFFVGQVFKKIPADLLSTATYVLYVGAGGFLCNMVSGVFSSAIAAVNRFDITNKIGVVIGSLVTLGSVAVLAMGYGVKEVVWVQFASSFFPWSSTDSICAGCCPAFPYGRPTMPTYSSDSQASEFSHSGAVSPVGCAPK